MVTELLPVILTAPQNVYDPELNVVPVFPAKSMLSPLPPFLILAGVKDQAAAVAVEVDVVTPRAAVEGQGSEVPANGHAACVQEGTYSLGGNISAQRIASAVGAGRLCATAGPEGCGYTRRPSGERVSERWNILGDRWRNRDIAARRIVGTGNAEPVTPIEVAVSDILPVR
jgi:hypothetical protein